MREWMSALVEDVSSWPGVTSHAHRFGGVEFRVGEREIGHVHSFGIVDIPFTVKIREALIRARLAEQHHWLPKSGWTTVRVKEHGTTTARTLLRFSYLRIVAKSPEPAGSNQAQSELESFEIEADVLVAAGIQIPAAKA